jgi:probable HAF family extracellular repeat protein
MKNYELFGRKNVILIRIACTLLLFTALMCSMAEAQQYDVTAIGTLGGFFSDPTEIDNWGTVVGISTIDSGAQHAFMRQDNQMVDLGTPVIYQISGANDFNSIGQIAGYANGNSQSRYAYLWEDQIWTALGTLPGLEYSVATGINDSSQIIGYSFNVGSGSQWRAWIWQDNVMTDLGTLGGDVSSANAINERGQVVGFSQIDDSVSYQERAFLWDDGNMTDLGILPGEVNSTAYEINEYNQAVGASSHLQSVFPFLPVSRPCIWNDGQITEIMLPQGYATGIATGINDNGTVVGSMAISLVNGPSHAFIWKEGVITNLNTLIPPGSGWWLQTAADINESGQIVGVGISPEGWLQGYLLTPLVTGVEDNPEQTLPTDFMSLNNYPNPFNAATAIKYSIAIPSIVSIEIFDILGRKVESMEMGTQSPGEHQITWNAEDQPSGLYFYRIQAGDKSVTNKMELLK